jgi:peptidoglycan hydrolase CwlO-like protein
LRRVDGIAIILLTIVFSLILSFSLSAENKKLINRIEATEERITLLEREVQDIQDNYVSFEALQPVLTDFEDYQLEVDRIRNNLNDFNGLWKQLFGYEQQQYNLRGR